ncbi:hypothetical protein KIL84_018258 [Mauremys mutica]|uniref:Uncharacterized protein n=1 Tax=Mauremys mutica TaxID=74926 RepID=A0A9D3XRK0_9SAUR|nr:hypothetical protein KIL84_018258 [Mauremys mutica]
MPKQSSKNTSLTTHSDDGQDLQQPEGPTFTDTNQDFQTGLSPTVLAWPPRDPLNTKSAMALDPAESTTRPPCTWGWIEMYTPTEGIFTFLDPQSPLRPVLFLRDILTQEEDTTTRKRSYSPR